MHIFDAIRSRRAVKYFDPEFKLSAEKQTELLDLAMQSPTAFNLQHWRFVVVDDPTIRQQIRAVAWDQAQVTDASMLVILCADVNSWEKNAARVWAGAPDAVREMMVPAIDAYYRDKPQVQRDEIMRSCGIAGQTLMLAARAMDLDSAPWMALISMPSPKSFNCPPIMRLPSCSRLVKKHAMSGQNQANSIKPRL